MDLKQSYRSDDLKEGGNGIDAALDTSLQTSDEFFCSRCDQNMPSIGKGEHEDWHFAKDLQAQEQDGADVSQSPPQPPSHPPPHAQQRDLKQNDNRGSQGPPEYAPPSQPPPRDGASRAIAIRHHTNQVIEAAKVRARDEVRSFSILA
jgi:Ubiquitin-Binding Zinc Finger